MREGENDRNGGHSFRPTHDEKLRARRSRLSLRLRQQKCLQAAISLRLPAGLSKRIRLQQRVSLLASLNDESTLKHQALANQRGLSLRLLQSRSGTEVACQLRVHVPTRLLVAFPRRRTSPRVQRLIAIPRTRQESIDRLHSRGGQEAGFGLGETIVPPSHSAVTMRFGCDLLNPSYSSSYSVIDDENDYSSQYGNEQTVKI